MNYPWMAEPCTTKAQERYKKPVVVCGEQCANDAGMLLLDEVTDSFIAATNGKHCPGCGRLLIFKGELTGAHYHAQYQTEEEEAMHNKCDADITRLGREASRLVIENDDLRTALEAATCNLTIPPELWQDTGSDGHEDSRLLLTVYINGTPCHLEAWAVKAGIDGVQYSTDPDPAYQSNFNAVAHAMTDDGVFETLTIPGREAEYVLLLSPFC